MFITTVVSVSIRAYVQALSCGIEHSSVCKKAVEYCVLTLWERKVCEKEVYGLLLKFCNF